MLNKSILLTAALFAAGCASSERMMRLSDKYEAPSSSRISGGGWKPSDMGGTQVNAWPLFARNNRYYSVLWPVFDSDPYGMAVRPFFNQEGHDYSVLFPLSAWNNCDGDGWVLTGFWNRRSHGVAPIYFNTPKTVVVLPAWAYEDGDGFGLWPLFGWNGAVVSCFYRGKDIWHVLGPFGFISFDAGEERYDFTYLLFGNTKFGGGKTYSRFFPLYFYKNIAGAGYLWTPLGGGSFGREDSWGVVANTYWSGDTVGSFPLFHFQDDFNYVLPGVFWGDDYIVAAPALTFVVEEDDSTTVSTLPLYSYTANADGSGDLWTLLGGGSFGYKDSPEDNWGCVLNTYWNDTAFGVFPLFHNGESDFISMPGVIYNHDGGTREVVVIPLLSGWEKRVFSGRSVDVYGDDWNLPFYNYSPEEKALTKAAMEIAGFNGNPEDEESFEAFLQSIDDRIGESCARHECTESDLRIVLGLLGSYDEDNSESTARALLGILAYVHDEQREYTRSFLLDLVHWGAETDLSAAAVLKHDLGIAAVDTLKCAAIEKAGLDERHLPDVDMTVLRGKAAAFDIYLPENPTWEQLADASMLDIKDKTPPVTTTHWRALWVLASGEDSGDRAEAQILWQLYNHRREGSESRTRVFPFVTVERNNGACETSWIWRKFISIRNADEGTSGYLMFIPW